MKKQIAIATSIILMACNSSNQKDKVSVKDSNETFDNYKNNFIEELWRLNPGWASSVGYHKYDNLLIVPNDAQRQQQLTFAASQMDSLKKYNINSLSDNNKTDYLMMENYFKGIEFGINKEKSFQWDPSSYNITGAFAEMLNNNYDTIDTRLRNLHLKMENIPAYYEAAKKNIVNPTKEHTQLAIDQNLGGLSVFEKDLPDALNKSALSADEKEKILARAKKSVAAIKSYAYWLKNLKNDNPRSFRMGKELYNQKFDLNLESGYTADQIYQKALKHKKDLHQKMAELTVQLWPKYFKGEEMPADTLKMIRQMIDKISFNHVRVQDFQAQIEKQIPELVNFIKEKNLIYLDPSKPLVIRREPDYMAGVAGASISSPGPYDKNGNTYYNVGSLSGWDKDKAESYLREYNHYILQILNIHEAIPGHYTQLIYSNQSTSLIKSILGNGAMIEGWAVYTERMMLEEGYGNNEPEMWLMYYKWNLRSTCNTILDYRVHKQDFSKEEAINFLSKEAFQQQAEAEGKWRRATLTQVQLCCYFTGYTEIYDFREAYKKQKGEKFNLKAFHEKFLSYGSAPVKYIKELMNKQ